MSINLSIAAADHTDLHAKLRGILYGLAQAPGTSVTAPAMPPEPKLTKKQIAEQAQAAAELLKEAETAHEKAERLGEKTDADTPLPTLEDLRASLMRLSKAEGHGSEAVFALLGEFGAKNASTVAEDKRAAVIAAVAAKLEG